MNITRFLILGYVVGIPLGVVALYDIARLKRRAFRISGHHKMRWLGWTIAGLISGWGAVLVGTLWVLGNARHDAIDVLEKQRRA
ncbi:unannotated protein [freshwater metagenome]|uniref:Unannotated protein n=1 Tax=freshwater metagenome TaxID=449393 RepID=A0A6J6MMT0_9ZZZZ|nr:hypothetical protein [Actinomycetota bacterium]